MYINILDSERMNVLISNDVCVYYLSDTISSQNMLQSSTSISRLMGK